MIVLQALMASGLLYAGIKTIRQLKKRGLHLREQPPALPTNAHPDTLTLPVTERRLMIASASLGLAGGGAMLHLPALGVMSLPAMLYVFLPTFRQAGVKLVQEGRIDHQVLIASRVAVCVVMNYTVIAALDALLHSASQRAFARQEADFRESIRSSLPAPVHALLSNSLEQAAAGPSRWQKTGERLGEQMAPLMLATFVLTLPLMGVNRAAAFLTTTFGAHLRYLGPYTSRQALSQAARQGILILHADALGQVARLDTLLLDQSLWLAQPAWHNPLRQQAVAIYLLTDNTDPPLLELPDGVAGSFPLSGNNDQRAIAMRLQAAGREVGYLSDSEDSLLGVRAFQLQLIAAGAEGADAEADWATPGIVLLGGERQHLSGLWELAHGHAAKQRFNLLAPTGSDLVDISTTVFLDFGLLYSVLFTYAGVVLSIGNTDKGRTVPEAPGAAAEVLVHASRE